MAERTSRRWWAALLPLLLVWAAAAYGGFAAPGQGEAAPHPAHPGARGPTGLPADTPRVAAPDPEIGERLFGEIGCNGCHTVEEVGGAVGPDLTEVGSAPSRDPDRWPTTEAYLRASLLEPRAYVVDGYTPVMPDPDALGLDPEAVEHLVAYLKSLGGGGGGS